MDSTVYLTFLLGYICSLLFRDHLIFLDSMIIILLLRLSVINLSIILGIERRETFSCDI